MHSLHLLQPQFKANRQQHNILLPPNNIEMSSLQINWKAQSADLLQIYEQLGLIRFSYVSIESWTRNNFTTWGVEISKGKGERSKRGHYTSVFTCPVTGMHFPAGKLAEGQLVDVDGVNYYSESR